jgi:hypothetical protein
MQLKVISVPMEAGRCLDLREMGSAWERGVKGRHGPPEGREDKQSTLSKEGGNMEKEEEGRRSGA